MKAISKFFVIEKQHVNTVFRERNLLAFLVSPFLCNLNYAFQNERNLYMLMDLCRGGDLKLYLKGDNKYVKRFDEELRSLPSKLEAAAKFYAAQVLLALEFLHIRNILHHDVKPANILMRLNGYVKLADLGVAQQTQKGFSKKFSGTPGYVHAPSSSERTTFACCWL